MRVGLISDTHGLVRAAVLEALARVAPVTAIRGNNDIDAWGRSLADTERVELGGSWIYLVHDLGDLDSAWDFWTSTTGS